MRNYEHKPIAHTPLREPHCLWYKVPHTNTLNRRLVQLLAKTFPCEWGKKGIADVGKTRYTEQTRHASGTAEATASHTTTEALFISNCLLTALSTSPVQTGLPQKHAMKWIIPGFPLKTNR